MLVTLVMGWVVDALVGSPAALRRQFEQELQAYLERRGFASPPGKPAATSS